MSIIPDEIMMEILTRVPVKTILRLKSVSKSFRNLITSREFTKLHQQRGRSQVRNTNVTLLYHSTKAAILGSFDLDHPQRPFVPLDNIHPDVLELLKPNDTIFRQPWIEGICNGVMLFSKIEEFVLYNPATRAYRQIPRRETDFPAGTLFVRNMFAYDCVNDDYKIVSLEEHKNDFNIYLYSLKDNSWSKIESSSQLPRVRVRVRNNSDTVYCCLNTKTNAIIRFNVSSHGYDEMTIPTEFKSSYLLSVVDLEGHLHVMMVGESMTELDIWMVTEDDCWALVFRCSLNQYLTACDHTSHDFKRPLCYAYSRDGHKIIIVGPLQIPKWLMCCDLQTQTINMVQILGAPEGGVFCSGIGGVPEGGVFCAGPWVESLVPLA